MSRHASPLWSALLGSFLAVSLHAQSPAQSPPATPQEPPPATGAISGVVVDGTTGEVIEDANVTISGTGTTGMFQTRQFTDAKGRFVFVNLKPGLDYALTADVPGYFSGAYSRDVGLTDQRTRIALKADEWVRDVRVSLWKPGVISGRVLDESGEPMAKVFVRALSRVNVAGREHLSTGTVATTDDLGVYRLNGLAPGRYLIEVPSVQGAAPPAAGAAESSTFIGNSGNYPWPPTADRDGRQRAYPITFYPSARSVTEANAVEVGLAEERVGIDVSLAPVPVFKIEGKVEGAFAGLTLRLMAKGLEELGNGSEAAQAQMSASGTFAFNAVPAGSYVIDVRRRIPEFTNTLNQVGARRALPAPVGTGGSSTSALSLNAVPTGLTLMEAQYGNNQTPSGQPVSVISQASLPVTVNGADITGLIVTLQNGGVMDGAFEFDVSPDKPDVARPTNNQVGLILDPASGQPDLGVPTATYGTGTFRIEGIRRGEYFLRSRNFSGWLVRSVVWNGQDYTHRPFDAAASPSISEVRVTLTNRVGKISGAVKERAAAVILFPADPTAWTSYGLYPTMFKNGFTANDGSYSFTGLPAGDYYVLAVEPSNRMAWLEPGFFARMAGAASRLSVGWGESQTANLSIVAVKR